jgi:transcriptional regulator with XRE-family HTH domain
MGFAQRLKTTRIDKSLSQTELGNLAGIHYTQIGRYENKGSQPSADILAKLANALGVSSDFLTNGSTDELAEHTLNDKELLN